MADTTVSEAVWNSLLAEYFQVAAITILVYDYCLTFSQEVSFIWKSRWPSTINVLYLLTRYLPFMDTGFLLKELFAYYSPPPDDVCYHTYLVDGYLFVVGIGISEIILMARILVIWDKDRRLVIGLPIFFAVTWIAIVVFMYYFLRSVHFTPLLVRCYRTYDPSMILILWVLFTAFEIVMLCLLLVKSIQRYRLARNMPLFRAVYRDGVLFYLFIIVVSASNIIIILTLPNMVLLFASFVRVMHSILTARFVLEIRRVLNKPDHSQDMLSMKTRISFASPENGTP